MNDKILIVAFSKITSAFDDIIEIEEERIFKGEAKRQINWFHKWYNDFTKTVYNVYYQKNAQYFENTVDFFNNYDKHFDVGSEKCTRMILIYGKLSSAKNDLEKLFEGSKVEDMSQEDHSLKFYGTTIAYQIQKLINKKFWNGFINMEDINGAHPQKLIESLDNQGFFLYN